MAMARGLSRAQPLLKLVASPSRPCLLASRGARDFAPQKSARVISTTQFRAQPVGQNYNYLPRDAESPAPPPPPPPRRRRLPWGRMFAVTVWVAVGGWLGFSLFPPAAGALPGTEADRVLLELIGEVASSSPVVKELEADPDWLEIEDRHPQLDPSLREQHMLHGALGGSRGATGYERVWYNAASQTFVAVMHLGSAASGWPGVAHGGLLAGLMSDESAWRPARLHFGGNGRVVMESVKITYLRPVSTRQLCYIQTTKLPAQAAPGVDYNTHVAVESRIFALKELSDTKSALTTKPRAVARSICTTVAEKPGEGTQTLPALR